jgi:hypothetical protein
VNKVCDSDYLDCTIDKKLKIPSAHLTTVCKLGCGSATCKYIGLSVKGYFCAKNTKVREILDTQKMKAQGNNCDGF